MDQEIQKKDLKFSGALIAILFTPQYRTLKDSLGRPFQQAIMANLPEPIQ